MSGLWNLETLWFTLIAILWVGYLVLEGFDFGVGILLPFVGRDDAGRRAVINTIGPLWDGNEVWLLVAGGATFAAFPDWYATLFSGFYLALFLILVALIARGVAFEYRSKVDSPRWRANWDRVIFVFSALPALLWGVGLANIVHGVPIRADGEFDGTLFDLLGPYPLLAGVTSLVVFTLHGALFLSLRTKDDLEVRAERAARTLAWPAVALLAIFLFWTWADAVDHGGGLIPGLLPLVAFGLVAAVPFLLRAGRAGIGFLCTAGGIAATVALLFTGLYPNVLVSSIDPAYSLTVWDSASTPYTLKVMTVVALALVPVVLIYQAWTYKVFWHRLGRGDLPMQEVKPAAPAPVDGHA